MDRCFVCPAQLLLGCLWCKGGLLRSLTDLLPDMHMQLTIGQQCKCSDTLPKAALRSSMAERQAQCCRGAQEVRDPHRQTLCFHIPIPHWETSAHISGVCEKTPLDEAPLWGILDVTQTHRHKTAPASKILSLCGSVGGA